MVNKVNIEDLKSFVILNGIHSALGITDKDESDLFSEYLDQIDIDIDDCYDEIEDNVNFGNSLYVGDYDLTEEDIKELNKKYDNCFYYDNDKNRLFFVKFFMNTSKVDDMMRYLRNN